MNDEDGFVAVQCEIDFFVTVRRRARLGSDEIKKHARIVDGVGELLAPALSGADAVVVPDIEALVVQRLELAIDLFRVRVRVADEDEGLVSLVCRERSIHRARFPQVRRYYVIAPRCRTIRRESQPDSPRA